MFVGETMQNHQDTLEDIIWGMEASTSELSLTLAICNYPELRDRLIESLHEQCALRVRTVTLSPDVVRLSDALAEAVGEDPPESLMVRGFESLAHLNDALVVANLGRDTFRDRFPFPLVLWMDDEVSVRLVRIAPDFENWAGIPSRFEPSDDELLDMLVRNADALFDEIVKPDACLMQSEYPLSSRKSEFLSFLSADLEERALPLSPESDAALQFFQGKDAQDKGCLDSAIQFYQAARSFWKGKDREREGVLLYFIAKCHEGRDDLKTAASFFRECTAAFAEHEQIRARCMCGLCGVLKASGDKWEELKTLAETALQLSQTCGDAGACASCHLFLTEAALFRKDR